MPQDLAAGVQRHKVVAALAVRQKNVAKEVGQALVSMIQAAGTVGKTLDTGSGFDGQA